MLTRQLPSVLLILQEPLIFLLASTGCAIRKTTMVDDGKTFIVIRYSPLAASSC
jgi:hypothetical protein